MKNKKLLALTSLLLIVPNIALAGIFSDLSESNRYTSAIEYLAEVGIIGGYPDGTFKPDQAVNRVEFLKLVLESSEVTLDVNTATGFADVDDNAWYAKYVRKAYSKGWVEGYPDGTFKPEQSINKVEALKIIGEVQEWSVPTTITETPYLDIKADAWYAPYIVFAKEKNFLEEFSQNYIPETIFSRAKISELLFRAFITKKSGADIYSYNLISKYPASNYVLTKGDETPSTTPIQPNFTPVKFQAYDTNFFENITLNEKFPNTFYLNEVYYFKGTVKSGNYTNAFVFLTKNGNAFDDFQREVNGEGFKIPVIFRETGNFKLGIIPGDSGESKVVEISVLPSLPSPQTSLQGTRAPTNLQATYKNQKTTFSWDSKDYELIKISLYQGNLRKDFILRQGIEDFSVDYKDFKGFGNGKTYFSAIGADLENTLPLIITNPWSNPSGINFISTTHQYTHHNEELITVNNLPEIMNTRTTIQFSGTAKTDILVKGAIIKPDGFVDTVDLTSSKPTADYYSSKYIPSGNSYTFSYTPDTSGTYSVEINSTDGSAVINTPVYVSNGIPLAPNFFDLYENNQEITTLNLQQEITAQLSLINKERTKYGLRAVVIDETLNNLSQLHSNDMIKRNFFGHINPDGKTPNDRRLALNIPTPVGENLAIAPTSEYTIYGLMQSGIHRKNILDPQWTKVGIGISLNQSNSLYTTQEFSAETPTVSSLKDVKNSLLNAINTKRASSGLENFIIDGTLETPADIWSEKMSNEDFFDFSSPSGESLADIARKYIPTKALQALILEGSNESKLIEEVLKSAEITNSTWHKIGIGINSNSAGMLKATVLFTTL